MRKLIALGVGIAATGTFALGPASPAQAVISPPGSVVTQTCNALPGQLTSIANTIVAGNTTLAAAQATLATRTATFTTAQTNLVAALVAFLQAIDAGGSVDAQQVILAGRVVAYVDQAVLWGTAWHALQAAELNSALYAISNSVLTGLNTGLCVPAP